jgi:hypothetical protein
MGIGRMCRRFLSFEGWSLGGSYARRGCRGWTLWVSLSALRRQCRSLIVITCVIPSRMNLLRRTIM